MTIQDPLKNKHDSIDAESMIVLLKQRYEMIADPRYKLMIRFLIATEPFCCKLDGITAWFRKLKLVIKKS